MSADRASAPIETHLDHARCWVAEEPLSRAVMDAVWRAEHGTDYAPTGRSTRAAVRLVVRHLWDDGDVPRPAWDTGELDLDVTPIGARLIDAFMFHLARLPDGGDVRWAIEGDPQVLSYGQPFPWPHDHRTVGAEPRLFGWLVAGQYGLSELEKVLYREGAPPADADDPPLRDSEFSPARARRALRPRLGGLIRGTARTWDIALPEPLHEVPEIRVWRREPLTVEELVRLVGPSDLADYTYLLWLDELAEGEWGTEKFTAYERRLAQEPGIEAVFQEDREPVYVLAPTLTAEQVLAAARRAAG
ncbi:hypothetical protein N866_19180 [Actinotalea ferrariae CF5-4]|uniref:Uncharacterized protein n=1 Tax=Actinotalea ferrariae CF5-4 TaxID=948458 RepID=A0A021VRA9_9CELL|nr:hypothetical protein [Actinotalea ferrariae]EYR63658.1 hypothetical protein N866_19180 [Actinotalea ferrariae CF5-4]